MPTWRTWSMLLGLVVVAVLVAGFVDDDQGAGLVQTPASGAPAGSEAPDPADPDASTPATRRPATTTEPFEPSSDVLADPAGFGRPWGTEVPGLLTFRGNPTRSYHGSGPMPLTAPEVLWQYPAAGSPMCGESSEYNQVRTWCGTGWTGQPAVFEREGRTWVVFGAYDYGVHFVDAATGKDIIPPFMTGDIAKGNVTVDPDGYPLVYVGSRDNKLRAIAFDGPEPRELWSVDGQTEDRKWNNDWDAAPLVVNGHLLEGGENSWFYGFELNRGYGPDGLVTVAPELTFRVPGFDEELLGVLNDNRVSLEASVSMSGDTAYLNSSGGLLQGWDLSSLRTGSGDVSRVFRYWTGDDSDATVVTDEEGYLYVGVEVDRDTSRVREGGQMLKIDPRLDEPVVWSVDVYGGPDSGTWSTPVVVDDLVVWPTKPGKVYGLDRATGATRWTLDLPWGMLSSAVAVDGVLVIGDAEGVVRAWDITDTVSAPPLLWEVPLGANIESTPAVWNGRIYVGTREGYVFALGLPES